MVTTIVFIVEEESKRTFLDELLARLEAPAHVPVHIRVAEGHVDIRREIRKTTRLWRVPHTQFVVWCDQDSDDCKLRKQELLSYVPESRLGEVTVRIVCTELEGWYLADKNALRAALPDIGDHPWPPDLLGPPDSIHRPASRLADFASFRKRDLAREMGRRISLEPNTSHSFNLFIRTLRQILADAAG